MIEFVIVFLILAIVFFISGFFETFIYKFCTNCAKRGNITVVSYRYEGMGQCLGYKNDPKFKIGAIHSMRLCRKCYCLFMKDIVASYL